MNARKTKVSQAAATSPACKPAEVLAIRRTTRAEILINLMGTEQGATAADLAAAVGWQHHSVRGFISGTLKKREDLLISVVKMDGVTRYKVRDRQDVKA